MKKIVLLVTFALLACSNVMAQKDDMRLKYLNLGFPIMKTTMPNSPTLKSDFGISLTVGRTYLLHKNPIGNVLYFGIDATWFDINYTKYKLEPEDTMYDICNFHQLEIGVQVGPSLTIKPAKNLLLHGYFRYAPSYSALVSKEEESVHGNYASMFVGGGSISYRFISVGVEKRFGKSKYKDFTGIYDREYSSSDKTKFSGVRIYLSFRF